MRACLLCARLCICVCIFVCLTDSDWDDDAASWTSFGATGNAGDGIDPEHDTSERSYSGGQHVSPKNLRPAGLNLIQIDGARSEQESRSDLSTESRPPSGGWTGKNHDHFAPSQIAALPTSDLNTDDLRAWLDREAQFAEVFHKAQRAILNLASNVKQKRMSGQQDLLGVLHRCSKQEVQRMFSCHAINARNVLKSLLRQMIAARPNVAITSKEVMISLELLQGLCLLLPGVATLLRLQDGLAVLLNLASDEGRELEVRCSGIEVTAALICADRPSAEEWEHLQCGLVQACKWITADGTPDALRNAALDLASTFLASAKDSHDEAQRKLHLDAGVGPAICTQLAQHARRLRQHASSTSQRSPSPRAGLAAPTKFSPSPETTALDSTANMGQQQTGQLDGPLAKINPKMDVSDAATLLQAWWRGTKARREYWTQLEEEIIALSTEIGRQGQSDPQHGLTLLDAGARAASQHWGEINALEGQLNELSGGLGSLVLLCDDWAVAQLPVCAFEDALALLQSNLFSVAGISIAPVQTATPSKCYQELQTSKSSVRSSELSNMGESEGVTLRPRLARAATKPTS
eukprot:SAG31_NODE_6001_length_2219_cov_1.753774_2_plen_577_part_01